MNPRRSGTAHEPDDRRATGFSAQFAQPPGRGVHHVCAYAINIGAGGNVLLGGRTVNVTPPGAGRVGSGLGG